MTGFYDGVWTERRPDGRHSVSSELGTISVAQKGHSRDCRGWEVKSRSQLDCKEEEGAGHLSFVLFLED